MGLCQVQCSKDYIDIYFDVVQGVRGKLENLFAYFSTNKL